MARVQLLASALGLMLTGPAFAGDPFTPLPPVQHSDAELRALRERSPGATGELALRLLAAHNR
jgi:hypothetical protein